MKHQLRPGSGNRLRQRTFILASLLLVGLAATSGLAQGVPGCTYTQLTDASDGDLLGVTKLTIGNQRAVMEARNSPFDPDGFDTFLYDAQLGEYLDGPDFVFPGPDALSMSPDDSHLAFTSIEDLVGGNPDRNREIFLFEIATRTLSQLTDTVAPSSNFQPRLSADGRKIAFTSTADLVTGQNPGGEVKAFVFDRDTGQYAQVTEVPGRVREIRMSDDGAYLAVVEFITSQIGDLWRVEVETLDAELIASSVFGGGLSLAAIDGSGDRIAFSSTEDLVPGRNPDGTLEVFVYDAAADTFLQISDSAAFDADYPSLSRDGRRIAYASGTGNPSTGLSVFVGAIDTGVVEPIVSVGRSYFPVLSADGQRVVFWGETDLTGGNPALDTEFFLAECPELGGIATIPTASGYGLALLALLLAGGATFLLRRRRHV
ncbi:MAG: hypothetical protein SX243_16290 [Acidobacteriota bacterium]|nr:hypothetical protein [Acidobacteriota bacterium]